MAVHSTARGILAAENDEKREEVLRLQDLVIGILHDEQGHLRLFEGFLREYEAEGLA